MSTPIDPSFKTQLFEQFAQIGKAPGSGALRDLINSPELPVWHHTVWHHTNPEAGPVERNIGIALSLWDWLFGTAYAPPGKDPVRLGFEGIESYPQHLPGQVLAPFRGLTGAV